MTNEELERKLGLLIKSERKSTVELLGLVHEAENRRLYLTRGHSSSYSWLIKTYGLSQTSAHRRIQSSRLSGHFPVVAKKLESGSMNLCTATLLQSTFSREEKKLKRVLNDKIKLDLILSSENKTVDQVQKILCEAFPALITKEETFRPVGNEETRLSIVLSEAGTRNLKRVKELLSHSLPQATWAELIEQCLEDYLNRKDPLRKMTHPVSETETGCVIPENTRRLILKRANGQCEFTDEQTNHRCECRHQIEIDHILPKALGGGNEPENLRALCRPHNLYEAERVLGFRYQPKEHINGL